MEGVIVQRERVAENVYSFQSDVYAQVTAGAVIGPSWAVVIDTLALPEESLEIRDFIEQELQVPVRYVINTHYHADHAWGNCLFTGATIVGHTLAREWLDTRGRASLENARRQSTTYRQIRIVLPHITFSEGSLSLRGEIDGALKENLAYLSAIRKAVRRAARRKYPLDILEEITVEDCGKSRVLIGGLAEELHNRNLRSLYEQIYGKPPLASTDDDDYDDEEEYDDES